MKCLIIYLVLVTNTFVSLIKQMLLFAEGTRFTPAKHKASMEFARKRGLPELKRHLIPRTRGFVQCVQSLKGNFPVIYDVTVGFNT